ncbi:MAG: hypothetical protein EBR82_68940 [Caulobacteraceae bacterium]|nr:hypothetical protein [Caulobacteraceae bacterium]
MVASLARRVLAASRSTAGEPHHRATKERARSGPERSSITIHSSPSSASAAMLRRCDAYAARLLEHTNGQSSAGS